jgi:hypothetical protein
VKPLSVLAAAFVTLVLLILTPSAASAASASAGRDNFWKSCSAQVHTSDATTAGKVEVFGGWGCAAKDKFTGTLVCILYLNGTEKTRVSKDITLASTLDCAVTNSKITRGWTCGSIPRRGAAWDGSLGGAVVTRRGRE